MVIKVGDLQVLNSGSVIGNWREPITFVIDKRSNFIIKMEFIEGYGHSIQPRINVSEYQDNGLLIQFQNFANAAGHGNSQPLQVGTYNNKTLYLNYRIHAYPALAMVRDRGGIMLNYTWLIG